MKKILKIIFLVIFFYVPFKNANSQVIYVSLDIEQPGVEKCVSAIETNFQQEEMKVFPNPNEGLFTISFDNTGYHGKLNIVISNVSGQVIYSQKIDIKDTKFENKIDLSEYPSGIYILNISAKKKYYKAEILLK